MSAYEITKSQYRFYTNNQNEKKKDKVSIKSIIIDPDPRIAIPKVERIDVDWTSNETNTITNPDDDPDLTQNDGGESVTAIPTIGKSKPKSGGGDMEPEPQM